MAAKKRKKKQEPEKPPERLMLEDAVRRVAVWCAANYPARLEVAVNVVDDIDDGEALGLACIEEDTPDRITIYVSAAQTIREAMETTMHEWAHALIMPWLNEWQNDHEDGYWIVYGRMYRRWHDQGGAVAAKRL